jgi:hypothetical protein
MTDYDTDENNAFTIHKRYPDRLNAVIVISLADGR